MNDDDPLFYSVLHLFDNNQRDKKTCDYGSQHDSRLKAIKHLTYNFYVWAYLTLFFTFSSSRLKQNIVLLKSMYIMFISKDLYTLARTHIHIYICTKRNVLVSVGRRVTFIEKTYQKQRGR